MMIFYHFTATEYLDAILRDGLTKGEVPIAPTKTITGVWLTTDDSPIGHGLSDGYVLTEKDRLTYHAITGNMPPAGARIPNKRAVRIKLVIPTSDHALKSWPKWARKRVDPWWYGVLDRAGGGKAATWWVYFGSISSGGFLAIDRLSHEEAV